MKPLINLPFKISGIGHYLPDKIESSKELSLKINKSEKWIIDRTGVQSRHISLYDVDKMGAIAAKKAISSLCFCTNKLSIIKSKNKKLIHVARKVLQNLKKQHHKYLQLHLNLY